MKKLIVIACSALAAIAASLTVVSQAAAAPDQSGQSFADAKAALTAAGYDPVVATAVGDTLPRDDCTVVRQQTTGHATPFFGSSGPHGVMITGNGNPKVMLTLDCNAKPK